MGGKVAQVLKCRSCGVQVLYRACGPTAECYLSPVWPLCCRSEEVCNIAGRGVTRRESPRLRLIAITAAAAASLTDTAALAATALSVTAASHANAATTTATLADRPRRTPAALIGRG